MKKSFKYRVEANLQTIQNATTWLDLCRNLYNTALEQRIITYRHNHKSISRYNQIKELPSLKDAFPEYKNVGSQCLQEVIERLDRSFQAFFRRVKNGDKPGFPRFKGRNRYDSFVLKQTGWKIEGKYLTIRHIGTFKLRLSRPIEGDIKILTIKRSTAGKWFVVFSCDNVLDKILPPTGKSVGIDVGCEFFLTTSDNVKIGNPRFFKKAQDQLAMRQQRLSRRVKGSHRREKARLLVAKAHEKIFNQRRDFHFKTANWLVRNYDTIFIEGMNAWNSDYRALTRSMRDVAWFGFFEILYFKAEEAGRKVREKPSRNTSQLCSGCHRLVPKDLSIHIHSCPFCGLTIDRHQNAALNILGEGQSPRCLVPTPRIPAL